MLWPRCTAFAQLESDRLTEFHSFGLAEPINRALAEENHVVPTPIQAQTVPLALEGRDIIGIAQTGTGKTAAFALPILHKLSGPRTPLEKKSCRVLVLSPTRELSSQILDSFRAYGRHLRISTALTIGGVKMGKQVRSLMNGVDVLVATPGRLLDLVEGNALRLKQVNCLVLDEADRMLDMGFIHDIRRIIAKLPRERQTLMFSATMPQAIAELAAEMLRDPAKVAVAPVSSTADRVDQRIVHVNRQDKPTVLAELLRGEAIDRALVFTRTKHGADKLVRGLSKAGIGSEAIHGNKSQSQRERVLAAFRQGQVRILVATDIAARGIDVEGISHVVNYDLPNEPESYVHRIGRTARAGASGTAISLCDADEMPYLRSIEKLIRMSLPATNRRGEPAPAAAPTSASAGRGKPGNRRRNGAPFGAPSAAPERGRPARPVANNAVANNAAARNVAAGDPAARNEKAAKNHGARNHTPKSHAPKSHAPKSNVSKKQAPENHAPKSTAPRSPVAYGSPIAGHTAATAAANDGRDARTPGYGAPGYGASGHPAGSARRGRPGPSPAQGHPSRDLSRVAFLNRGIEPRHDSVPHRQSTGVRKHGEGRAD
jgi:ATP-dependent RNA helicase RhlE